MKNACMVMTTIFESNVLDEYYINSQKYGHLDQVKVFVIPDKKTPRAVYDKCKELNSRGWEIACPTIAEQEAFLKKVAFPTYMIPYNSDNRRNIGYLMAFGENCDMVISIDDDNFPLQNDDFFLKHSIVGDTVDENFIEAESGWYNICQLLDFDKDFTTYPRGFPYFARHTNSQINIQTRKATIHINAGLWLNDPDVDGISWMVAPVKATGFRGESLVFADNTWGPINTQNTALIKDAIPAYYFTKMGYPMGGNTIDRYGDIFSGYLVQACMKSLGGSVRFGSPVAEHRRNSHNYLKDAKNEWACIILLEDILPWLHEVSLSGGDYLSTFEDLSWKIPDAVEKFSGFGWDDAVRGYFHQLAHYMRTWVNSCRMIHG